MPILSNVGIYGCDTAIEIEGHAHLNNVTAYGYQDTGLKAKNAHISGENLYFEGKDARLGWDLDREVVANMYDGRVLNNGVDIQYGPEVLADFENITAETVHDDVRKENPLLPTTGIQDIDLAVNTTEEMLRRERNRSRAKKILSTIGFVSTANGIFDAL